MENFFSMWKVRELADKVTNVVMNYTEIEAKVREATNDEAWGPTGQIMQELAHSTFTYEHFPEVMSMLWKRMLQDNKQNWRRTYKSLLLLNYLIKNGSERVVTSAREHIYDLRSLENYSFLDELGKDQGVNIRHKVKELIEFVQDDDRLREERKKAKKNKDKYTGISSDTYGMRFGSTEMWDEKPSYRKDDRDYEKDWDDTSNHPNSYRDQTYEDEYDEVAGKNSDSESNKNQLPTKKYADVSERTTSSSQVDNKVNINISSAIANSPKKTVKPIKKVDLGAAANFGKETSFETNSKKVHTDDLLNDDFDPRSNESKSNNLSELANFESAFSDNQSSSNKIEEFADFTSAFDAANNKSSTSTLYMSQQPSLPSIAGGLTSEANELVMGDVFNDFSPFPSQSNLMTNQSVAPSPFIQSNPIKLAQPPSQVAFPPLNVVPQLAQNQIFPQANGNETNAADDFLGDLQGLSLSSQPVTDVAAVQNNNGIPSFMDSGSLLMPMSVQSLQPMSSKSNNNSDKMSNKSIPVGPTWTNSGNLNIDIDNLMLAKPKQQSPSMNQLASTPTSPINQPKLIQKSPNLDIKNNFYNIPVNPTAVNLNDDFFANFK